MRIMAARAALAHGSVFENEGPRLLPMALSARLVLEAHRETMRRLHNIHAMRIMTLNAIHLPFGDGVMLRQVEFGIDILMTFIAGPRILSRVDDELFPARATNRHMLARRAVARFATVLPDGPEPLKMKPCMRTRGKRPRYFWMTISANLITHKSRPFDHRRSDDAPFDRRTRFHQQREHPQHAK
jgi:hypothetical protein